MPTVSTCAGWGRVQHSMDTQEMDTDHQGPPRVAARTPQTNDGACNSSTPPPEMAAPLRPGRSTPKAGEMSDNVEGARSPRYWQNIGQTMYDFGRGHTHRHTDRQNFYIVSIMKSWNRGIHQTNKYRDTNRFAAFGVFLTLSRERLQGKLRSCSLGYRQVSIKAKTWAS